VESCPAGTVSAAVPPPAAGSPSSERLQTIVSSNHWSWSSSSKSRWIQRCRCPVKPPSAEPWPRPGRGTSSGSSWLATWPLAVTCSSRCWPRSNCWSVRKPGLSTSGSHREAAAGRWRRPATRPRRPSRTLAGWRPAGSRARTSCWSMIYLKIYSSC